MAPDRNKASTHKDQRPEAVNAHQFPHRIQKNDLRMFLIRLTCTVGKGSFPRP
jgi:hypothetical protein